MCGGVLFYAPMSTTQQTPHYTRRTLAARWQCSIETLKRREKAGHLPFLKLGKSVRYRADVIERIEAQAEVAR